MKKVSLVVAGAAAAGALVLLGGPTLADAATKVAASTRIPGGHGGGHRDGSHDTPVTGDELAKVTAAVKAKDSSVTVSSVRKDPDGSYDVFATKSGSKLMYDVSADLKTITERQGRHHGRDGSHTPVTGDELAKVTAAVKAKDSSVTVTSVRKDPDGSYDVLATKAGANVRYEVSADLKSVTVDASREGHGHRGGPRPAPSSTK